MITQAGKHRGLTEIKPVLRAYNESSSTYNGDYTMQEDEDD